MNRRALFLLLCVASTGLLTPAASRAAPAEDPTARVAPERLTQGSLSADAYAFKQRVYRLHVERGTKAGRRRVFDLAPPEIVKIPGTNVEMRKDAAAALGRLLEAARADLARDLASTAQYLDTADQRARAQRVQDLAVNNAYRSASLQFSLWDRYFQAYLRATQAERAKLPGGEFGPGAAEFMRDYVGVRVAAPGFSNHQSGIAVDLALKLKPDAARPAEEKTLSASMSQADPWKESWFWRWLNRRAGEFGFVPYQPEPWHWEYKPDVAGKGRS